MGHVVNPISHRVSSTLVDSVVLHTRYNAHYAFIYNKLSFVSSYVSCMLNSFHLRQIVLLDRVKIFQRKGHLNLVVSLYSSQVTELCLFSQQCMYLEATPLLRRHEWAKRYVPPLRRRSQLRIDNVVIAGGGRRKLGRTAGVIKQPRRVVVFFVRWFLHMLLRVFYLRQALGLLRHLFVTTLSQQLSYPIRTNFLVISQEGLSADGWATFIKYKLKRKATFGKTMSVVLPILNKIFRSGNLLGYKIMCNGRTSRRGRASSYLKSRGKFPYSSVVSYVSYSYRTVILKNSICGIKVWLFFKGVPKFINADTSFII